MMKWNSFRSGMALIILGMALAVISFVWTMGVLMLDADSATTENRPASSDEYVRGLEARMAYLEAINANLGARLDRMEREYAEQKTILDDLIRRDEARREGVLED